VTDLEGQIIGNIPAETEAMRLEEENAKLRAQLEAVTQDDVVRLGQVNSDVEVMREQLRVQRDELERAQIERSKLADEVDALRSERDSFQRLAERLSGEEQQAKELLMAATKAAEELRVKARRDAEDLTKRTEESVLRMEEEARVRVDNLRKEYERIRVDYDTFLLQGRDVAQNLVRKLDDARAKWPL
jgi:chromosome segregation ATPase